MPHVATQSCIFALNADTLSANLKKQLSFTHTLTN